jgi:SAM-dependent methyltransferase
VAAIRKALTEVDHDHGCKIIYFAPWDNSAILKENSADMIYSQAVLEHVNDLEHTYRMLYRWLKPGGFMSHQIDFKSHGYAAQWNGHWAYSDFVWNVIRGRRPYLLNRQPHETHVNLLARNGFKVVCDRRSTTTSAITRGQLARRFQNLSDEDLVTSSTFMQAVKVGE